MTIQDIVHQNKILITLFDQVSLKENSTTHQLSSDLIQMLLKLLSQHAHTWCKFHLFACHVHLVVKCCEHTSIPTFQSPWICSCCRVHWIFSSVSKTSHSHNLTILKKETLQVEFMEVNLFDKHANLHHHSCVNTGKEKRKKKQHVQLWSLNTVINDPQHKGWISLTQCLLPALSAASEVCGEIQKALIHIIRMGFVRSGLNAAGEPGNTQQPHHIKYRRWVRKRVFTAFEILFLRGSNHNTFSFEIKKKFRRK